MIMGNTHIIFLHIQIEYLKCEFWEFESSQNKSWLIFNKCLKLAKWLYYYFHCRCSIINLRLRQILLARYFHGLSKNIWFTKFGSLNIFLWNFEQGNCIIAQLKRINSIWIKRARGNANWAGPLCSPCAQRAQGGLTSGAQLSVRFKTERVRRCEGRWIKRAIYGSHSSPSAMNRAGEDEP